MLPRLSPAVVAIGNLNIDIMLGKSASFPKWGAEIVLPEFEIRQGGQAANFAVSITKLGCNCRLMASVGDDILGQFLLEQLRESEVDASYIAVEENSNTAICVAIIRTDGERAFITFLGHLGRYDVKNIKNNMDALKGAKTVHYGGYFMLPKLRGAPLIDLFKVLRGSDVTTSFDPGWDPEGWESEAVEEIVEVLKYVDIFLPNIEEVKAITGCHSQEDAAKEIARIGPKLIAIKMGPRGCFITRGDEKISVPAFKVDAIDTVGAGDIFDAGVIYGVLKGWRLEEIAVFSNALSAIFVSRRGKLAERCPTFEEVEEFLIDQKTLKGK